MGRRRTKKVGMTRGLGPRYGGTVRKRYTKILTEMKKPHKCPQCGAESIRRKSVGIWTCRKCGLTFAGGAYTPTTKLGIVAKRAVKGPRSSEAPTEEKSQEIRQAV